MCIDIYCEDCKRGIGYKGSEKWEQWTILLNFVKHGSIYTKMLYMCVYYAVS